jgi:transposase
VVQRIATLATRTISILLGASEASSRGAPEPKRYTPTYSSWLNQVERWFGLITQRAIRRGSFDSVPDLKRKIHEFVKHYNQYPKPFMWTATAESILAKLERLGKVICGTQH